MHHYKSANLQICNSEQMCKCANVQIQIYNSANLQISKFTNPQISKFANLHYQKSFKKAHFSMEEKEKCKIVKEKYVEITGV